MTRSITHFLMMSAVFVSAPWAVSCAQAQTAPIAKEEVDANGDGVVSPEESRAYILGLERAHEQELQRAQDAAREAASARALEHAGDNAAGNPPPSPVVAAPSAPPPAAAKPKAPPVDETPVEMKKAVADAPANDQKKLDKRLEEMKSRDLNNDGILQASELKEATAEKFSADDLDKDGILSPAEMEASLEKFRAQQMEDYGTARGKQEALRLKNRLKNADADHDGILSRGEYEGFMNERQSLYDRDGDGIISEEEYRTDGEKLPSTYRKTRKDDARE